MMKRVVQDGLIMPAALLRDQPVTRRVGFVETPLFQQWCDLCCFNQVGNVLHSNLRLTSRVLTCENGPLHAFSSDVGTKSSWDDIDGSKPSYSVTDLNTDKHGPSWCWSYASESGSIQTCVGAVLFWKLWTYLIMNAAIVSVTRMLHRCQQSELTFLLTLLLKANAKATCLLTAQRPLTTRNGLAASYLACIWYAPPAIYNRNILTNTFIRKSIKENKIL